MLQQQQECHVVGTNHNLSQGEKGIENKGRAHPDWLLVAVLPARDALDVRLLCLEMDALGG